MVYIAVARFNCSYGFKSGAICSVKTLTRLGLVSFLVPNFFLALTLDDTKYSS